MKKIDVYAYGVISASTLHLLNQPFPQPDGYAEISETYFMTGGEALNSAIVLSRLRLRVQLDGNWIGDNQRGADLLAIINKHNIDAKRLSIVKGYAGVQEIVFSDERSRTIFGNYIDLLTSTRKWNIPQKEDIQNARMVSVDPPFFSESELVANYAIELGIPYVSIDYAYHSILSTYASAVIISGEFRNREYPDVPLIELFQAYQTHAQGLVVFTVGSEEILYGRKRSAIMRYKPYPVKVIDSSGAGDSFRAGMIYGMLKNWNDEQTIQYASAVAGMVCASFPGVLNSPTAEEVALFIQQHSQPAS